MKIEMHEVGDMEDLLNPGDYILVERSDTDSNAFVKGNKFPIIICPGCKSPGHCSNHTLINEKPLTIRASFLCNHRTSLGKVCGWHGFVTDGFMVSV